MTFLSWLVVLLVVTLCAIVVLVLILNHLERKRWMRAFGVQYGIPPISMEDNKPPKAAPVKLDLRPRMSIPVPGGDMFRKPEGTKH